MVILMSFTIRVIRFVFQVLIAIALFIVFAPIKIWEELKR